MQQKQTQQKNKKSVRFLACLGLASFFAGMWMVLSQYSVVWFQKSFTNISTYVIFVLIFVVTFAAGQLALPEIKISFLHKSLSKKQYFAAAIAMFLAIVCAVIVAFCNAKYVSGGDAAMEWGVNWRFFVVVILLSAAAGFWAWHRSKHTIQISHRLINLVLGVCIALLLALAAVWAYTPNNLNFLWDYEAYWFSVLASVRGLPLSWENSSFYGHYNMLMTPFFNLLGGFTPARAAFMLSLEGIVVAAGYCYVLWFVTKNSFLRFIGLFAATNYFATVSTIEGQMTPHRVVFPVLLMAFAAFYLRQIEKRGKLFSASCIVSGYVIAVVGMIWSTDSGIAGILGWSALHFYTLFTQKKAWWCYFLSAGKAAACIVLCVVLAWQATSMMNVVFWQGEAVSFQLFFAPLMPEPAPASIPLPEGAAVASAQEGVQSLAVSGAQVHSSQSAAPNEPSSAESQTSEAVSAQGIASAENAAQGVTKNLADSGDKHSVIDGAPPEMGEGVDAVGTTNGYIDGLQIPLERKWVPWVLVMGMLFVFLGLGLYDTVLNRGHFTFSAQRAFGLLNAVLCAVLLVYFFNRVYYYNLYTSFFSIAIFGMQLCQMALNRHMRSEKGSVEKAIFAGCLSGVLVCVIITCGFAAGRSALQIRKIRGCQQVTAMSVFFSELKARVPANTRFIGIGNTYYNAALDTPTDVMMMHPWMNTFRVNQKEYLLTQTEAPLAITDRTTYDSFERLSGCTVEDLQTKYDGPTEFRLNYANYDFEESHTIYLFTPKQLS